MITTTPCLGRSGGFDRPALEPMKKKRKTPEGKPLWQVFQEEMMQAEYERGLLAPSIRERGIWLKHIPPRKKPFDNPPEKSE